MDIEGSVAFVTGANRGLGDAFVRLLVDRGAAKVYGAARDPRAVLAPGVIPVQLDITDPAQLAKAVAACPDVTLLVNNAGTSTGTAVMAPDAIRQARVEMETNAFGALAVSQAFAPVLAANGGGAIVNVLSVLSWLSMPSSAMYSASKAAAWSITNSLRLALAGQGTQVVAVHCGFLDTDMAAAVTAPKLAPARVVELTFAALAAGDPEVLADETTQQVRAGLSVGVAALYPALAAS